MSKTLNQIFDEALKDFKKKNEKKKKFTNEMCSQDSLAPVLGHLRGHRDFKKLKISHEVLAFTLRPAIEVIVEDLKEYKSLVEKNVAPVTIKQDLSSIRKKLEGIEGILYKSPILSTIHDHLFEEGEFESTEKLVRLTHAEAISICEKEIESSGTIKIFRNRSAIIRSAINQIQKNLSNDLIWSYRLNHLPPGKRNLFYFSYSTKNKLLFVVAYYLSFVAQELGIKTKNGQAEFIEALCPLFSRSLGRYFKKLGKLDLKKRTGKLSEINEIFRSKSWGSLHKK